MCEGRGVATLWHEQIRCLRQHVIVTAFINAKLVWIATVDKCLEASMVPTVGRDRNIVLSHHI